MQLYRFPDPGQADALLARPAGDLAPFRAQVGPLLDAIRREGDTAVRRFAEQFDGIFPEKIEADTAEFAAAEAALSAELKNAIRQAYANIRTFHAAQHEPERRIETATGVVCWRKSVAVEKVGLYVPGGTAPLFSTVLMLGVPAQLAACREVILCTPPRADGSVHPAVLFAAELCGIRRVFKIGGAQAIGAMAYGTATVPRVWKIFGPGNPWVTAAKQLVSLDGTAIDLPAGPSEVAVVADASANPDFVAADLLSQAEHGADSQVLLICTDESVCLAVQEALDRQLATLPRRDFAAAALQQSRALLVQNLDIALSWANDYAPEHLILHVENPACRAAQVTAAGSVFLGGLTPESAGDYASGTNHTLPTGGWARATGGVSLDSFYKKITFQQIEPEGLRQLAPVITRMARAEGLEAHARAVELRLQQPADGLEPDRETPAGRLEALLRPNIRTLRPYSSARDEAPPAVDPGQPRIFLDANENSLGGPLDEDFSRYPDPGQGELRQALAAVKGVRPEQIFLGNGSDEAIDLLLRACCEPGRDNVLLLPPTYGMYAVQAAIQDVEVRRIPLRPDFTPDVPAILAAADANSKLLFLCSPNNPTGNCLEDADLEQLLTAFPGLVVVDEAYIDFAGRPSALRWLDKWPKLVVLQTFSKAWGLAGLRVGMAFGHEYLIRTLNNIKYPYNLNALTSREVRHALQRAPRVQETVARLNAERTRLAAALAGLAAVKQVFASEANFLLVRTVDADGIYRYLCDQGIVVRNRTNEIHCDQCLRITVGTPAENDRLVQALAQFRPRTHG